MGQLGFSASLANNPIYLRKPHIPPDSSGLPRAPRGSSGCPPGSSGFLRALLEILRAYPEVLRRPSGRPDNVIPGLLRAGSGRSGSVRFGPVRSGSVRFGPVRLEARGNTGRRPVPRPAERGGLAAVDCRAAARFWSTLGLIGRKSPRAPGGATQAPPLCAVSTAFPNFA